MRQPTVPNSSVAAGPSSSNHFHRLPPIPQPTRHELPIPPPMRTFQTVPPPPPIPARPGFLEATTRPSTSQGISRQHVATPNPFPVPPPPPPIPPRIGQGSTGLSPNSPADSNGSYHPHTLHRPLSQVNLNAARPDVDAYHAQLRAQREEEERKAAEEFRLEKERLREEQEELHRQARELERMRQEERDRQAEAMEKIRKEQEELARLKAKAREEEERRLEHERWAEEERKRRQQWEEEERIKRELQREQWRVEEEERRRKLQLEMEDERFAAVFSMREEIEAERLKHEAEEKSKAAVRAAEAEIARAKEEAERKRQEKLLQEQKDAEMARNLEKEEDEPSTTGATASHSSSTVQTPQQVRNELPDYEQLRRPQVTIPPPPAFKPESEEVHPPPHMRRPHANTTAGISPPPPHLLPLNQPLARPTLGMSNGSSPIRHSMALPLEHVQQPPAPLHTPMQHPGFPNAGTGHGPPYHNHFFPDREAENSPITAPAGGPPARPTGPAKLVRQTHSLGGRDPGRVPAHNANNSIARNGPFPAPMQHHPGHVAGSPSLPMLPTPLSTHSSASTANPAFSSPPVDVDSSPGAGGSNSPMASTSNVGPTGHIINEYPLGNASQRAIEPLSGIIHGFGRPALRDSDLPAATPVPDVITLEPEPSPPYFIVAHTWKSLVKFLASQNVAIIEPSPVALAREKHGPPNLRVVLHFAKIPRGDYRIVLYFALQSITPPPQDYPSHDTSVPPYMFPAPDAGRPLANVPEAQVYTIPTKPLPLLPMKVPNLAPYLSAAYDESLRNHDSRARLVKLVNTVQASVNTQPSVMHYMISGLTGGSSRPDVEAHTGPPKAVETSSGQKGNLFSRMFRPKTGGSKGKGLNNDMYDVVTPFNAGDYR